MFEAIAVIAAVAVGGYLLYTKVIRPRYINRVAPTPHTPRRHPENDGFGTNGS